MCLTSTLYSSWKARIRAAGHAEPPVVMHLKWLRRCPVSLRYCSKPIHTVGTAELSVQRSCSSSLYSDAPSKKGPTVCGII